jgi:3-keto-5-aminohexanoate cleavage enzyme
VGFENNLFLPDGALAKANCDLVAAARIALESCGRRASAADELREMITQ